MMSALYSPRGVKAWRKPALLAAVAILLFHSAPAAAQGGLERARQLYNAGSFDQAIAAAEAVRARPRLASSADLVIARCQLEKFRAGNNPKDLEAAHAKLTGINLE